MENNSYKTKTEKDLRVTYIYNKDAKNFKNSKNPRIVENKKSKLQLIGELTLGIDEPTFKKLHNNESKMEFPNTDKLKSIKIIENGPQYIREQNPYEKMINLSMIDIIKNTNSFSFESKAFYERAIQLSLNPGIAAMNDSNPIFNYIANPKDCRYYYYEGI